MLSDQLVTSTNTMSGAYLPASFLLSSYTYSGQIDSNGAKSRAVNDLAGRSASTTETVSVFGSQYHFLDNTAIFIGLISLFTKIFVDPETTGSVYAAKLAGSNK